MKHILFVTIVILCALQSQSKTGAVLFTGINYPTNTVRCILNSSYTGITLGIQATMSGLVESDIRQLQEVVGAGFNSSDVIYLPCRGKDPKMEVSNFVNRVHRNQYQRIWLFSSPGNQAICSWAQKVPNKCDILVNFVNEFKSHGVPVGIFNDALFWKSEIGDCQKLSSEKLYWFPEEPNGKANFDDFKPFGGWTKPEIKFYDSDKVACGTQFGLSYTP